jgi:hypothetical protein
LQPSKGKPSKPSKGEPNKPSKGKPSKPGKGEPSKPQKPGKEEGENGMCIDGEKMMKMCLAGSSLGEKSPAAMETCDASSLGKFPTLVLVQRVNNL